MDFKIRAETHNIHAGFYESLSILFIFPSGALGSYFGIGIYCCGIVNMKKVLAVFGTRPEAIKMAPLVKVLTQDALLNCRVCVTGQHREMLGERISAAIHSYFA